MGNWIWKINAPPKIKCFIWKCWHQSIPARAILGARGLNIAFSCPFCNDTSETILHILRDCPIARRFWNSFPSSIHANLFYGSNLSSWLQINYRSQQPSTFGIPWGVIFHFRVWSLWLNCNKVIFRDGSPQKSVHFDAMTKALEFAFLGLNGKVRPLLTTIQVRWIPP